MLLHLGDLHAYEKALVAAIALGPFLVLFVLVALRQRGPGATVPGQTGDSAEPGAAGTSAGAEDPAETRTAGSEES